MAKSATPAPERQQFIPVSREKVKQALLGKWQLDEDSSQKYSNLFKMFEVIWHHDMHHDLEDLKKGYDSMNPDSFEDINYNQTNLSSFLEKLDEVMMDGNWLTITDEEIDEALEGEDILPISLDVRFDEFSSMKLYRLGDSYRETEIKSLFGLKKETKNVRVFSNVLTVLEFKDEKWFMAERTRKKHYLGQEGQGLHIRLFKDVPHLDMEVIFPNTSPSMRTLEKIKIGAPLVGGIVSLSMKYGPILFGSASGDTSLSLLGGLLTALGTYVLKTYTSYQKTREKFRSAVAKDMYFKGIANNQSALTYMIDMAEEQEVKEAICAYMFVQESDVTMNEEELDEAIEEWLLRTFGHDIDFEVDDALAKLEKMNLLSVADDGKLSVVSVENALVTLDDYWDNLYDFVE
ncbi:MAG: DUF3754 domain-containing protein [Euryarchaeota archaeon]|nr:DUF3754 domain-containing protein [Euryarchaeota archaeon]MBT5184193.1 DUF3754 domain-containing protein [Euryarchaeota archaeon]